MQLLVIVVVLLTGTTWITEAQDEITLLAQGTCSSLSVRAGWVYAVKRPCSSSSKVTCADVCRDPSLKKQDSQLVQSAKWGLCLESIHVYKGRPALTRDRMLGPKVFRYHSCYFSGCRPNYCCCWFM